MTDDFNEFFDDNTHWVEQGSEPMRGAEPPEPPKSRREMRKRRAQRRRKRISGIIIAIAIVALLIGGGYFGVTKLIAWRDSRSNQSTAIADYPGPGYGEVEFTVSEGQGAAEIADNLLKAEVIKSTAAFTSVVNANSTTLYPGTFTLKKHMAASKVIDVLSDTNQAAGFLEVRPGERATDVFANAAKLSGIAQSEFDTIIKNKGKDILPNEAGGSFEGWLEPGTYNVKSMKSASEILKAMVDKRIAKLDELGVPAGSDRERVMIIASIAEAEVNKADYYGKVTRVIENRLEQGMSLGMDSTVAYGNNVKPAQVTTEMTQDESNPYNTYKISGLPPTPISNPGDNAIQAALHPEGGNWLYFCTAIWTPAKPSSPQPPMNMTRTWPNYASGKPKTSSHPVSFLRLGKLIGRWSLHWLPRRGELSAKKRTEGSTAGNVTLNLSPGLPRSGWKKSRTTPQQPPPQSRPPISPAHTAPCPHVPVMCVVGRIASTRQSM